MYLEHFQNDNYEDDRQNWEQVEVGLDYNAALSGVLARMSQYAA